MRGNWHNKLQQKRAATLGAMSRSFFPDGERYIRLLDSVSGRHIVCLGATANHESTLDLYDLASVVVAEGARRLSIAIPYFGYSTMERATKRGEAVVAKFRARLFSSIPNGVEQNQMLFFDLHSPGIPHYLENGVGSKHLSAQELLCEEISRLGGSDFVLAVPMRDAQSGLRHGQPDGGRRCICA